MKKWMKSIATAIWSHRACYAGLALAYGAGCVGWLDKTTVNQIATALYVAIASQRH